MKAKYLINLHKALTFIFVLALMVIYKNFTIGAWVYLALHGTYGILWLLKDQIYPDKKWEQEIPVPVGIFSLILISLYWVAPFILISSGSVPSSPLIAAAISINILGVFLHYSSDAQKYYTLKYKPGLITEGFFARCRNTNYLGEFCTYLSFALLTQHWLPFAILGLFTAIIFVPNILNKDKSLSRYSEFQEYKANSGLFLPKIWGNSSQADTAEVKSN